MLRLPISAFLVLAVLAITVYSQNEFYDDEDDDAEVAKRAVEVPSAVGILQIGNRTNNKMLSTVKPKVVKTATTAPAQKMGAAMVDSTVKKSETRTSTKATISGTVKPKEKAASVTLKPELSKMGAARVGGASTAKSPENAQIKPKAVTTKPSGQNAVTLAKMGAARVGGASTAKSSATTKVNAQIKPNAVTTKPSSQNVQISTKMAKMGAARAEVTTLKTKATQSSAKTGTPNAGTTTLAKMGAAQQKTTPKIAKVTLKQAGKTELPKMGSAQSATVNPKAVEVVPKATTKKAAGATTPPNSKMGAAQVKSTTKKSTATQGSAKTGTTSQTNKAPVVTSTMAKMGAAQLKTTSRVTTKPSVTSKAAIEAKQTTPLTKLGAAQPKVASSTSNPSGTSKMGSAQVTSGTTVKTMTPKSQVETKTTSSNSAPIKTAQGPTTPVLAKMGAAVKETTMKPSAISSTKPQEAKATPKAIVDTLQSSTKRSSGQTGKPIVGTVGSLSTTKAAVMTKMGSVQQQETIVTKAQASTELAKTLFTTTPSIRTSILSNANIISTSNSSAVIAVILSSNDSSSSKPILLSVSNLNNTNQPPPGTAAAAAAGTVMVFVNNNATKGEQSAAISIMPGDKQNKTGAETYSTIIKFGPAENSSKPAGASSNSIGAMGNGRTESSTKYPEVSKVVTKTSLTTNVKADRVSNQKGENVTVTLKPISATEAGKTTSSSKVAGKDSSEKGNQDGSVTTVKPSNGRYEDFPTTKPPSAKGPESAKATAASGNATSKPKDAETGKTGNESQSKTTISIGAMGNNRIEGSGTTVQPTTSNVTTAGSSGKTTSVDGNKADSKQSDSKITQKPNSASKLDSTTSQPSKPVDGTAKSAGTSNKTPVQDSKKIEADKADSKVVPSNDPKTSDKVPKDSSNQRDSTTIQPSKGEKSGFGTTAKGSNRFDDFFTTVQPSKIGMKAASDSAKVPSTLPGPMGSSRLEDSVSAVQASSVKGSSKAPSSSESQRQPSATTLIMKALDVFTTIAPKQSAQGKVTDLLQNLGSLPSNRNPTSEALDMAAILRSRGISLNVLADGTIVIRHPTEHTSS